MHYFHMCFWGLVCHINDDKAPDTKIHAALVDTRASHEPKVVLASGAEYPITGNLTYTHGSGSAAAHAGHFRDWVPSLREVTRGSLKTGVYNKTDTAAAVYVDYPAADALVQLKVVHLYQIEAIHRVKSNPSDIRRTKPVARLVMARVPTNLSQIELRFGGLVVAVDSDACILICNVERSSGGGSNHFEYFTNLLNNADVVESKDGPMFLGNEKVPTVCAWILTYIKNQTGKKGGVKPECGNSTFP